MNRVVGLALALALIYVTLWCAYHAPGATIAVLDGIVTVIKTVTYPLPSSYGAVIQLLLRFLLPAFIFVSLVDVLYWGVKLLLRAGHQAYLRYKKWRAK